MKYDYCIIGSGIGGGMLLDSLVKNNPNCKIAIIEAGGKRPKAEPHYESDGLPFKMITTSVQLGGTSNLWHGVLSFLDDIDFKKRSWIPQSGWPIKKENIMPYYKRAAVFFGIEEYDYFFLNRLNAFLKKSVESINFNKKLLENKLFQQPKKILSLKRTIKEISDQYANVEVFSDSTALELKSEASSGSVSSCVIGVGQKQTKEVLADKFIICAGALETPRLLLNSKWIKNKNIGRYLMDHPMGNLVQLKFRKKQKAHIYSTTPYGKGTKIKTGLVFTEETQEKYKLPNHNFYIRPSFVKGIDDKSEKIKLSLLTYKSGKLSLSDIKNTLLNLNVVRQILTYKLSLNVSYNYADLFFMTEQVPSWDSFVGLSDKKDEFGYKKASVNWHLTDYDLENMRMVYNMCLENFFDSKDFEITHTKKDFNWENIFTSGAHHVGTARMASSEENGVVDADLKVFNTNNLYVCDGSVFPTSGNVNVGLTIAAMAMRLADHLETGA
ncbi:GMC family oxidoreductase [uncultured Arcticibacterium sp.]|uniref:GMC family oxidoreductase n=1 Tax=uncultured Arcticibacterium sp. TaxID=2173042 RepID=UPI0030F6109E